MCLSEFLEVFAVYEGFAKAADQENRKEDYGRIIKKEKPLIRSLLLIPI